MSHHFSYAALTLCLRFPSFGLREGNCQKTLTRSLRRSHWIIFDSRSTMRAYAKSRTQGQSAHVLHKTLERFQSWRHGLLVKVGPLLTNVLREAYAEISIFFVVSLFHWKKANFWKRRLLKEVCGFLFGISMNFNLAPLQYRTYRRQVAYATSFLQKAYASLRNQGFGLREALIWHN